MKLIFPNEGLSNSVNENIHSCKSNLQNALNNCHFSVPSGFAYTNYVNSLYSEINSCIKEINDIKGKIKDTDTRLDNLNEELSKNIETLPSSIIKERGRIIKF